MSVSESGVIFKPKDPSFTLLDCELVEIRDIRKRLWFDF